jgi:NRPS condensation-like uncharacterized protein
MESKAKGKVKSVTVASDAHLKIKVYCAKNNLTINDWVEKQLLKIIEENDNN